MGGSAVDAEAYFQLVKALEVPTGRALGAVNLNHVLSARAYADTRGLQGAHHAVVETYQHGYVVFVFNLANLIADLKTGVAHTHLGGDRTLGDEGVGDGTDGSDTAHDVLGQVCAVAHQVGHDPGASLFLASTPGQRA